MSQIETKPNEAEPEVMLAEEHFWECYSPRGELPLSSVASLTVHGLVFGLIIFGGLLAAMLIPAEASRPPRMDVIEIEGGGGLGGFGGPPGPGGPVTEGPKNPTENVQALQKPLSSEPIKPNDTVAKLKVNEIKPDSPLEVPQVTQQEDTDPVDPTIFAEVQKQAQQRLDTAQKEAAQAMKVAAAKLAGTRTTRGGGGGGGLPGAGGGRGGGVGGGFGSKRGPGGGTDPNGQLLTKTEKRERRWEIDFSGTGAEHVKKLKALNITLAIPLSVAGLYQIYEFSNTAARVRRGDLVEYKDKVKWFNVHPPSLAQLAQVLGLQHTPQHSIIFLPQAMEEELARLEVEFRGVPESQIRYTRFEIRARPDGTLGPVVVDQERKK